MAALQVAGIAWSVVLLRRWRTDPARRPHGVIRLGLSIGLPIALNLAWLWALLFVTPGFSADSLALLMSNEVGWTMLVSGAVALIWGVVLRPVLVLTVLRRQPAPKAAAQPATA